MASPLPGADHERSTGPSGYTRMQVMLTDMGTGPTGALLAHVAAIYYKHIVPTLARYQSRCFVLNPHSNPVRQG